MITTYTAYRNGAFKSRMVIEIRKLDDTKLLISVMNGGESAMVDVLLDYVGQEESHRKISQVEVSLRGLRTIHLAFDTAAAYDLELWIHHLQPDNSSVPMSASVQLTSGSPSVQMKGQYIVPIRQPHYAVQIQLN